MRVLFLKDNKFDNEQVIYNQLVKLDPESYSILIDSKYIHDIDASICSMAERLGFKVEKMPYPENHASIIIDCEVAANELHRS